MFRWQKPNTTEIEKFIAQQADAEWTYPTVGSTREGQTPPGFTVDHTRAQIGTGLATYEAACDALRSWRQFELGWVSLHRPQPHPEVGQTVLVLAHTLSLWVMNAARIIYVVEDESPRKRFAFAYGTLPRHVERGEERFQVDWDPVTDAVHYDILAFSQPKHWLTRLAYPYTRRKQKQFARESVRAMRAAVAL